MSRPVGAGVVQDILEPVDGAATEQYNRPSTGYGAAVAAAHLSNALNSSRPGFFRRTKGALARPIAITTSSNQIATDWCSARDTVLVGGPKHNRFTRRVLTHFGCQGEGADRLARTAACRGEPGVATGLGLATEGNTICWFGDPHVGSVTDRDPDPDADGYNGVDYGVVLRVPSPLNPSRRMVVVFGSQTFGVAAAAL
jgi:hypothetical protein